MRVHGQLEFAQLEQTIPGSVSAIGSRIYADITAPAAIIPRFHDGTAYRGVLLQGLGYLVNADVNASAAIAYSKLNLGLGLVDADIVAAAAIAPSKLSARQVVVGAAKTIDGFAFSTTFVDLSDAPTVSLTAAYSGKYLIFVSFPSQTPASDSTVVFKINNGVGGATINFSQETSYTMHLPANDKFPVKCWVIATLTAGVAYTFTLQGKGSAGFVFCLSSNPTNGVAMVAMQIE